MMDFEHEQLRRAQYGQQATWIGGMDALSQARGLAAQSGLAQSGLAQSVLAQQAAPNQPNSADQVYQPSHYARYTIEPATFIAANKLPFDVGNVVKYVCRYDAKNGREDLKKAARYIEMLIERLDREDRVKAGEDKHAVWSKIL